MVPVLNQIGTDVACVGVRSLPPPYLMYKT